MRLSEWRAKAPSKEAGGPKVAAVVDAVLDALGADADPHCWVAWGEDPAIKYTIFVPTESGLIASFVRVNIPGEGPRATTKLIRWSRVVIGELTVETQAGHRLLSFQIEQQVLRGADEEADRVAMFARRVIAAIDGRTIPPDIERSTRRARPRAIATGKTGDGPRPKSAVAKDAPKPRVKAATKPTASKPGRASAAVSAVSNAVAPRRPTR
ncbi:MAG TPA: hypothetical protein VHS36_08040 [Candidatus Limnocylindrales bacterium]|jgi:hypothetical protein|nr:hypothetical protein [Candidatus Limnocylindrales bacterium]